MLGKTLRQALWFVVGCCVFFAGGRGATADSNAPALHVAVHNDARVGTTAVVDAERAAGKIFALAGLRVEWVNCGQPDESAMEMRRCAETKYPTHLQLRILGRPRNLTAETFGISYLNEAGKGCYSEIFAGQVEGLRADAGLRAMILGHVMAHELAHLLLGTNSHAAAGIMRAKWHAADFRGSSEGELLFSSKESDLMREKLFLAWNTQEIVRPRNTPAAD